MNFAIIEPRSVEQLRARITFPEYTHILDSSDDRLEYIRQTDFAVDGPPTFETMVALREVLREEFKAGKVQR